MSTFQCHVSSKCPSGSTVDPLVVWASWAGRDASNEALSLAAQRKVCGQEKLCTMSAHLTVAAPPLQILREQSSISHLSILGRGELDFRGVPGSQAFELGLVHFLTSLRLKTDWGASIFIPATMQLQSLELYAPALHLSAEEEAWPQELTDLCIMTAELLYDTHSGPPGYACVQVALTCLCMLTCSTAPTILAS